MKKYFILCLIPILLSLITAETRAFVLSDIIREPENAIVAYIDDRVEITEPSQIKICFLSDAEKYEGWSIEKLFDKALPPMTSKVILLAAVLNMKSSQWMFVYTKWLGTKIVEKRRRQILCPYCGKSFYLSY